MAITNVDGLIAGVKPLEFYSKQVSPTLSAGGVGYSPFYVAGIPGAAVAPTPGIGGAALTSYSGQIPVPAASNNTYLTRFSGTSTAQGGVLMLCDRLWHNSGITITSTASQTVNSVTFPARDVNGSTNGDAVYLGVEVSTATGAATPTITATYTNAAGTGSRTATNSVATVSSSGIGYFYTMDLAAGDKGVRSIQSVQLSASWVSGTIHLVAYRILATVQLSANGLGAAVDALTSGLPRMYDNSVPFVLYFPQTTTATRLNGSVIYAQG